MLVSVSLLIQVYLVLPTSVLKIVKRCGLSPYLMCMLFKIIFVLKP